MVKLLRRIFIKDFDNVSNIKVREKHGLLSSITGIITNVVLFIIKMIIGIFSFSMSIISDAINNLTDLFSCILSLVGFKIAAKPADKRHPYGHERVEYITGLVISLIIIGVSITLGYTAINKLINGTEPTKYSIAAFIILGISIATKFLLGLFYKGMGTAINSESLKASMFDSFCDSLCTLGVLIAAIINYFYADLIWIDAAISLCVAVFIFYTGIKSSLESVSPLIGTPINKEILEKIKNDVLNYDGILGVHDLNCHTYGHTKIFVIIHAEVDGYKTVLETHEVIDQIEADLNNKYGIELTIHMDPVDTKNKGLLNLQNKINDLVKGKDPLLSIHDFHAIEKDNKLEINFDILKNSKCDLKDDEIRKDITSAVENLCKNYKVHINNIDYDFN